MSWQNWKQKLLLGFDGSGNGSQDKKPGRLALIIALLVLLLMFPLAWYFSAEPELFSVIDNARRLSAVNQQDVVVGSHTTATLITIADTLLKKNGGFLSNDILPPMVLLDNIPAWEFGVLVQVRDLSRALRDMMSRSQSQSTEDTDLMRAESRFNIAPSNWMVPAAESEYKAGINYLKSYLKRLADEDKSDAQFYARADNLRYWLGTANSRLGSLSKRLGASVGQQRRNIDLAGDSAATQSTPAPTEIAVKTPWMKIDDVFYEARGACWALIHILKAVDQDFADVLQKKNARESLQQIIRELEATQQAVYSPIVLNGSGFGVLANHSLVMASYISRANAALIDLRDLLSKG